MSGSVPATSSMPVSADKRLSKEGTSRRTAPGRDRLNPRGDATRQLLIVSAERLFAQRGIATTPLRDIGIAAGQKNHAVVQYHFGDRESLVAAIMAYRARFSEEVRLKMFEELCLRGQPQVSDLVRIFVFPLACHLEHENHYLSFMSRFVLENGGYSSLGPDGATIPSSTARAALILLGRLLPGLPDPVLEERCMLMLAGMLHTLARYEVVLEAGDRLPLPMNTLLEDLVQSLTAGLVAPVGPATATFRSAAHSGPAVVDPTVAATGSPMPVAALGVTLR